MKFWYLLLIVVVVIAGYAYVNPSFRTQAYNLISASPCDTPLPYKIGSIDARFGLSNDLARADINKATEIWHSTYGKQLFKEDPRAQLTVNFVYDARQALDRQINSLQSQLDQKNNNLDQQIVTYKQDAESFRQKLSNFNQEVNKYNSEGGAPPDVYQQLITEQKDLASEGDTLNQRAKDLQLSTQNYNLNVDVLNQDISNFNTAISQKPEEGLYNGQDNTISIYFVDNKPELVHTLTHEFGHALGMDHVTDPKAIMYKYTSSYLAPTQQDIAELASACRKLPIPEIWMINLEEFIHSKTEASQTSG